MTDFFLYNGEIIRGRDLQLIEKIANEKSSDQCILLLVTNGGDPDAAYKMGKYIQSKYESFKILIPGLCKSAGTLLAISADELIFTQYGELGPLDVQMNKEDSLMADSGLNISEAFRTMETRAKKTFHELVAEIVQGSGGVVSFPTASHCAAEILSSLYGPIFSRFDPEEVGSRSRAMRIGEDYGKRLNGQWRNLKPNSLQTLSQSYSSHSFVIDSQEASALFVKTRAATKNEMAIVNQLEMLARYPNQERKVVIENLSNEFKQLEESNDDDKRPEVGKEAKRTRAKTSRRKRVSGKNSPETI